MNLTFVAAPDAESLEENLNQPKEPRLDFIVENLRTKQRLVFKPVKQSDALVLRSNEMRSFLGTDAFEDLYAKARVKKSDWIRLKVIPSRGL